MVAPKPYYLVYNPHDSCLWGVFDDDIRTKFAHIDGIHYLWSSYDDEAKDKIQDSWGYEIERLYNIKAAARAVNKEMASTLRQIRELMQDKQRGSEEIKIEARKLATDAINSYEDEPDTIPVGSELIREHVASKYLKKHRIGNDSKKLTTTSAESFEPVWRSIQNAPQDDTYVLVTNLIEVKIARCPYGDHIDKLTGWTDEEGYILDTQPTHWMPLPSLPNPDNSEEV